MGIESCSSIHSCGSWNIDRTLLHDSNSTRRSFRQRRVKFQSNELHWIRKQDGFWNDQKFYLVGIVNLEPDEDSTYSTDLSAQRKMSRELIQQAPVIRANLKGPERRRLTQLVSDLELILLQIANLEAENDVPEIELVKSGVDRKGVLFKINVEQMRMSGAAESKPDQKDASGEKKL